MKLSARNQLRGKVKAVRLGTIMSEVTVQIGDQEIVAAITRGSAESLQLAAGDDVTAKRLPLLEASDVAWNRSGNEPAPEGGVVLRPDQERVVERARAKVCGKLQRPLPLVAGDERLDRSDQALVKLCELHLPIVMRLRIHRHIDHLPEWPARA